ncbi:MAG: hypothetical protein L0154_14795 [Chloroflexi bacterium]|nr:hypothetical protein [Chloroflexota bacterium]
MPTVQILAFRGTGGFRHPQRKQYPGLIKIGHVGVKFADNDRIFGFHPPPETVAEAGGEDELLQLLLQREAQQGMWQDNTQVFELAHQLHQQGERTEVWVLDQEYDVEQYEEIWNTAMQWYNDKNLVAQYNLPKRDGTFESDEYNCATFLKVLGIVLPMDTGSVAKYIDAMKNEGARSWSPQQDSL